MTSDELKTIIEMIRLIIADSKDKEDALNKIDSLAILKNTEKEQE